MGAPGGETLKILVATDNHLGYLDTDPIRRDDSFEAFEEIFQEAKKQNVDCVLLGGDLFHENKPSRYTLVRTIEILRKHCLSDSPIGLQVLSDQSQNFSSAFSTVNYEDANFNIGLPVFSIHGNHDDPTGADNLAALDVLSACNLVNYFGKTPMIGGNSGANKVRITPILLKKGDTKVALYGLGNIRDERLGRLFQTKSVEWVRPEATEEHDVSDWFNIFVLHQNRVARGSVYAKNCIPEKYLAKFLDFVIWGHEHESLPEPVKSGAHDFEITQPGSSVATSLAEGEAKQKHILLLEIAVIAQATQWRVQTIPLKTVRPFVFDQVALRDLPITDPDNPQEVETLLEAKVEELIQQAKLQDATSSDRLPLIRLKVDYTGFSTINSQRFGQRFVDKVANPNDVLAWSKSTAAKRKAGAAEDDQGELNTGTLRPEALDHARVESLISQHLAQKLEVLPETELNNALDDFVSKDENKAIGNLVREKLRQLQDTLSREPAVGDVSDLNKHIDEKIRTQRARDEVLATASTGPTNFPAATPTQTGGPASTERMAPVVEDFPAATPTSKPSEEPPSASQGRASTATGAAPKSQGAANSQGRLDRFLRGSAGAAAEREPPAAPSARARGSAGAPEPSPAKAAPSKAKAAKPAAGARARGGGKARGKKRALSSEEEEEEVDDVEDSEDSDVVVCSSEEEDEESEAVDPTPRSQRGVKRRQPSQ
ncbi:meiotic recombination, partial [Cymbomonas tetramitiformis]